MKITIEQQVNTLLSLTEVLARCIAEAKYREFSQQQEIFAYKMQQLLEDASQDELSSVVVQLKQIQTTMRVIQADAHTLHADLKNKSLAQQRAKKRAEAYK